MAGWITYDYKCAKCGVIEDRLMKRDEVVLMNDCRQPDCDGIASRILSANITRVTYVDGNDRFKHVKEKRKLDKLAKAAKKSGDKSEMQYIQSEQRTLSDASKKDRKSETPCKVSLKE